MDVVDYCHTYIPDYSIRIGIKDGDVIELDWSELLRHYQSLSKKADTDIIYTILQESFRQAAEMVKTKS